MVFRVPVRQNLQFQLIDLNIAERLLRGSAFQIERLKSTGNHEEMWFSVNVVRVFILSILNITNRCSSRLLSKKFGESLE